MFTFATKQSSVTKLWCDGFIFYKDSFAKIWYVIVAMMLLAGLLNVVLALIPFKVAVQSGRFFHQDVILMIAIVVISFMVNVYCVGVIFHRMCGLGDGENLTLVKSMRLICGKYLTFCAVILAVVICIILGSIALVIPGIFLAYLLMFSLPLVICDDNVTAFQALKKSAKLVWGNWWRTFGVIFPSIVLVYGLPSLTAFLLDSNKIWGTGIESILMILLIPLMYAFILVQFNDLKLRRK